MNIKIIDDAIPSALREQVWNYLLDQTWHIEYKKDKSVETYVPRKDGLDFPHKNPLAVHGTTMARIAFAADDKYLKAKHSIITTLWESINQTLGDNYELTGYPEGMPGNLQAKTAIPGLKAGWRVYTNAQYQENIKHSHGIHRDTPDLNDATTATILYVANLNWYPSWFAECVYYLDRATGDQQQFQTVDADAQRRNFDLGWAEQIVSPKPGRIIAYDGRTLHTTRPAAIWAAEPRVTVAFRARLK
jgi:hypothetical protein